jgi:excisionase family DNA binding protein
MNAQNDQTGLKGGSAVISPFMTIPEACQYLRTSRAGLYRMIDAGEVAKPVRRGGRAFFRRVHIHSVAARLIALAMDSELGL